MDDDRQLRPVLAELRALGAGTPEPSAALAALMAGTEVPLVAAAKTNAVSAAVPTAGTAPVRAAAMTAAAAAGTAPVDELAGRRRAKRRIALTTLSVAVALSAGGAVAAASDQTIRESLSQLNQAVTSFVTGSGGVHEGNQPEQPAAPLPTGGAGTAPTGTAPGGPVPGPAGTVTATQPATAPPSGGPAAPGNAANQPTSPGKPGEVPAPESLPGNVPEHITKGLGRSPEVPVPSQVPLPATLPAVPLP
jgi:hypothetical protein